MHDQRAGFLSVRPHTRLAEASEGCRREPRRLKPVQIVVPFLQMLERYNGMAMTPVETDDALEQAIATAPAEEAFDETPAPVLTLVANR